MVAGLHDTSSDRAPSRRMLPALAHIRRDAFATRKGPNKNIPDVKANHYLTKVLARPYAISA